MIEKSDSYPHLFSKFQLGSGQLKNRIVHAAMSTRLGMGMTKGLRSRSGKHTIKGARGVLKEKPGDKPFRERWADYKTEEKNFFNGVFTTV